MFGLSMTEIILIAVIALVVIGPKKLPDIAKSLGKGYGEFRRTFNDLKQTVNVDLNDTAKPSGTAGRHEDLKQDLAETYKSQWEQKLPPAAEKNDKDADAADDLKTASVLDGEKRA